MNIKYHLKSRDYTYDNRQLWFENSSSLIKIFNDKDSAEKALIRYNLQLYIGQHIYQFIGTMNDKEIILENLERFLSEEFNLSMRVENSPSNYYNESFRLPRMTYEQCQKVHDIVGITWCIIEEKKPSGLFVVKNCYGSWWDDVFWVFKNEFKTYEEAEDAALHCIAFAIIVPQSGDNDNPQLILCGSLDKISKNSKGLQAFLNESEYFFYRKEEYLIEEGIHIRKPLSRVSKKIKVDFGLELEDWIVNDFENAFKKECEKLTEFVDALKYTIVEI